LKAKIRKAGKEANAQKAVQRAADIAPIIADLQAAGATSLQAIAGGLNDRSIPTARGGSWSATQFIAGMERRGICVSRQQGTVPVAEGVKIWLT
jgi:hypothetical protein